MKLTIHLGSSFYYIIMGGMKRTINGIQYQMCSHIGSIRAHTHNKNEIDNASIIIHYYYLLMLKCGTGVRPGSTCNLFITEHRLSKV